MSPLLVRRRARARGRRPAPAVRAAALVSALVVTRVEVFDVS